MAQRYKVLAYDENNNPKEIEIEADSVTGDPSGSLIFLNGLNEPIAGFGTGYWRSFARAWDLTT